MIEDRRSKLFYGYVVVAAAFFIILVMWGSLYSFGVFFQLLLDEFGWTRTVMSGAFSLHMVLHGCLYIITGKLTDKFGPRLVVTVCGLFLGLGFLLMSQVNTIWQLYLFYGVIIGIGISGGSVPLLSTVAKWFVKKRGMMTGTVSSSIGLGTVIMPSVAGWLISTYGWRSSYVDIGIIVLVVIVIAAQFLRRDPSDLGLVAYGASEANAEGFNAVEVRLSFRKAIYTRQVWLLCVALFSFGFYLQTVMVHVVLYATGLGISVTSAASILAAIGGASIAGRLIMGSAGDRVGNKLATLISLVIISMTLLWLLTVGEVWMLYLFAAVFGFVYGGIAALMSPLVAELFGLRAHGIILGMVSFSLTTGGAVGPVLASYIFDVTASYQLAFLICLLVSIISIVALIFLKPVARRTLGRLS